VKNLVTAALLGLSLAACSGKQDQTAAPATTAAPTTTSTTTTAPPPASTPLTPLAGKFGKAITYPDGTKIIARYVGTRPMGPNTGNGDPRTQVDAVFSVTITAGSTPIHPINPSDAGIAATLTYGQAGRVAEGVCDAEAGLDCTPSPSTLTPGHRTTLLLAFAVPRGQARQLVLTVPPEPQRDPATFE
jgi:hypothetical protein